MLNIIWIFLFLIATLSGLYQVLWLGHTDIFNIMMGSTFEMAKTGFEVSLGLAGVMTLWLGLMRIGEASGAISFITKLVSPFFRVFFPEIPAGHPVFGSMMMNISANMLGLDNAATPLGLKAMKELQELNSGSEEASASQIMFLVINTASVTLIPITVFTYLYELGYPNPMELLLPILIATFFSTLAGLICTALFQKINLFRPQVLMLLGSMCLFISLVIIFLLRMNPESLKTFSLFFGNAFIFFIIISFITMAFLKKVDAYKEFIHGAKEGFQVAISIIPYLIAILVAVGIFRASGAMELFLNLVENIFIFCAQLLTSLGIMNYQGEKMLFVQALPVGIMKSLSGSGARGLMIETIKTQGVDSLISKMVAVMQGSSETTFYVLAVYCGAVGIKKTRYAVFCALFSDAVAVISSIILCYVLFS
ncbi:MAG: hypothetical protein KBD63_01465 [Bacteriovoracaceae bacterium]|nr:hypothetical protein [Bacteriovoracaceae bacterium]